ncbi:glutathione transferase GstA [Xinfangfangia sp. CPCC 101601]|uniref:Glutathione transferase GstA n=1 Tax=Pseudogemmobacter lacusdianii TaxID=3069608 RepID=A0ABU0W1T6_9RHOB|nr:glutathione transferase GstA [Xinfangfangia sp. CPCC 101601]MDQ2067989.1 glutathione transferase GstA [Xinfangfangia sp. CPCC 101601]
MKLYYSPGACSLASHIALEEVGATYSVEKVDIRAKKTESGEDFRKISPRAAVPTLELDNGEILTEGVAIMQYVMDSAKPGSLPAAGTLGRARLQEALNFVSTEIHKNYAPFFYGLDGEAKAKQTATLDARLALVEEQLGDDRAFLTGADYSPADAYFFTVTNWSKMLGHDLAAFPRINALRARVAERPAVQAAMRAEGLI